MTDEKTKGAKKIDRPFYHSRIIPVPKPASDDAPYPKRIKSTSEPAPSS